MKEFLVRLSSFEEVKRFVALTSRYPYPVHAVCADKRTNAKSLIGLFSMDLSRPVTVRAEGGAADTDLLLQEAAQFLA